IISDVKLLDASNNPLPLHPRWISFDAATFNQTSGILSLRFYNLVDRPLIIRDIAVRHLPRMISIDAMMEGAPISDVADRIFQPWPEGTRRFAGGQTVAPGGEISVPIGDVRKRPYVLERTTKERCAPPANDPEDKCQPDKVLMDLFPATSVYITATVV